MEYRLEFHLLYNICHYLNMSVEEIFTLDDNNSSYQKAEE